MATSWEHSLYIAFPHMDQFHLSTKYKWEIVTPRCGLIAFEPSLLHTPTPNIFFSLHASFLGTKGCAAFPQPIPPSISQFSVGASTWCFPISKTGNVVILNTLPVNWQLPEKGCPKVIMRAVVLLYSFIGRKKEKFHNIKDTALIFPLQIFLES